MLYNQLPQTGHVSIPNPVGGPDLRFTSAPGPFAPSYGVPFGDVPIPQSGRAGRVDIAVGKAVEIPNLLTCAAVISIYTNALGAIQKVSIYHAHTGDIPADELPTHADRNNLNVPLGQIHVVFASGQAMNADPNQGIQTAADGLIDIFNAHVPPANIRVLTYCNGTFGANWKGEVGGSPVATWANGDLQAILINCANQALTSYAAQFPAGRAQLGFLGSGHNLADGRTRIQRLINSITASRNDTDRLNALQAFLSGPNSFKAGSLKLFVVQQLNMGIRGQPAGDITALNARTAGNAIVNGVRNGTY